MILKYYNNVLTKTYHKQILKLMESRDFPWTYEINTHGGSVEAEDGTSGGFHHTVYYKDKAISNYASFFLPIVFHAVDFLEYSEIISIQRIMCNLTLNIGKQHNGYPHIDKDFDIQIPNGAKYLVGLYYVNDSDGATVFYDKNNMNVVKKIEPKKNDMVIFDIETLHSAMLPLNNTRRLVVNTNFILI